MMNRKEVYGPIYRTWLGPIPIVHVSLPEYVEVSSHWLNIKVEVIIRRIK